MKKRGSQSGWVGPGYVVGIQEQESNAWVACGGRCFLVAGEHLREAVGDVRFTDPEIQKAVALLKKILKEATYEDLVGQADPEDEGMVDVHPLAQDIVDDAEMPDGGEKAIPKALASLAGTVGWHIEDHANLVLVSQKAWAFHTPDGRGDAAAFPLRSTWVFRDGAGEVWWGELSDSRAYLPEGAATVLVTQFRTHSQRETCLEDVPGQIKRQKERETSQNVLVAGHDKVKGKTKLRRMLEKEFRLTEYRIPAEERELYRLAEEKEWNDSCEILSKEESERVEREEGDRILLSRFRNKRAGLRDQFG